MENWVRRIAQAYGVSYDAFLKHAVGRTGHGARDMEDISEGELKRLSAGAGVSVERLQAMNATAMMRRMNTQMQGLSLSKSGREAQEELRAGLDRMARQREANTTANASHLARLNWDLYGV